MNKNEFEAFVMQNGKDILNFCRLTTGGEDAGNDLYQDTMLKLLQKRMSLKSDGNVKSYALSVAILLWKNRKKKAATRQAIAPVVYASDDENPAENIPADESRYSPELIILKEEQKKQVRHHIALLPEDLRLTIYLFYSADMKIREIAEILGISEGTVKTRMRMAKNILKTNLEESGYDR